MRSEECWTLASLASASSVRSPNWCCRLRPRAGKTSVVLAAEVETAVFAGQHSMGVQYIHLQLLWLLGSLSRG